MREANCSGVADRLEAGTLEPFSNFRGVQGARPK
jgi:hypothetical protein